MSATIPPMTTSELAAHLGLDPRTIQRQADAGLLPTIAKLPGKTGAWLFDRKAVEALGRAA